MTNIEEEEGRRIAAELSEAQRRRAMDCCASLGFTLDNTPGVAEIRPHALGMKGQEVDFDALEPGDTLNDIKWKPGREPTTQKRGRVDLSAAAKGEGSYLGPLQQRQDAGGDPDEFIQLDADGQEHDGTGFVYNNRTRRKLRRALDMAVIKRELLVRERAQDYCKEQNLPIPTILSTIARPVHKKGQRVQENGALETAKQERGRARLELTEYNRNARVLRSQAKQNALEAGLHVYAERTGRIPKRERERLDDVSRYGEGWLVAEKPDPKDFLRPEDVKLRM